MHQRIDNTVCIILSWNKNLAQGLMEKEQVYHEGIKKSENRVYEDDLDNSVSICPITLKSKYQGNLTEFTALQKEG